MYAEDPSFEIVCSTQRCESYIQNSGSSLQRDVIYCGLILTVHICNCDINRNCCITGQSGSRSMTSVSIFITIIPGIVNPQKVRQVIMKNPSSKIFQCWVPYSLYLKLILTIRLVGTIRSFLENTSKSYTSIWKMACIPSIFMWLWYFFSRITHSHQFTVPARNNLHSENSFEGFIGTYDGKHNVIKTNMFSGFT